MTAKRRSLSRTQGQVIKALVAQRLALSAQVQALNAEIQEIDAAIQEQKGELCAHFGLDDGACRFVVERGEVALIPSPERAGAPR